MKRKFIALLLAFTVCLSLSVAASASTEPGYIVDEIGHLAEAEIEVLNLIAAGIQKERGIAIFFVYTRDDVLSGYDVSQLVGGIRDYYVMLENGTNWYTFSGGRGDQIDPATEDELRAVYDRADTYVGGIEAYLYAAAECFPVISASEETKGPFGEMVVNDEADLISDSEEADLISKLHSISRTYNTQIVIATIPSLSGTNVDHYVELYYDTMGLGYGADKNGILLLVCMNPREYRILSNGSAADAITPGRLDAIGEAIVSDLSDGDYADAFDTFAEKCAYYLDGHLNGFPFQTGKNLLISLSVGLASGLIVAFVLKGQLKSVRRENQANAYVKSGSMQITAQRDLFLYRNVTRTKKESSSSSSGKSGSSRNVGGGRF